MSFVVETDDGAWEMSDNFRDVVTAFFQAIEAANPNAIKFTPR